MLIFSYHFIYVRSTYFIILKILIFFPPKKSNFNDLSLASIGLEKKIIDEQAVSI